MKDNKPIYVAFVEKKLEEEFESLKEGKFQDLVKYFLFLKWV